MTKRKKGKTKSAEDIADELINSTAVVEKRSRHQEAEWARYRELQNEMLKPAKDKAGDPRIDNRKSARQLIVALMEMPYEETLSMEPELAGLTYQEVMIVRQIKEAARKGGDISAFKYLMDRVYGKPTNFSDNTTRDETLAELLDRLDEEDDDNGQSSPRFIPGVGNQELN